jgi:transcriptional regulator of arginine metabolism
MAAGEPRRLDGHGGRAPAGSDGSGAHAPRPASAGGRRREATRTERERRIREILTRCAIETQEDLVERLRHEGLAVTQATVSRDIKRLGLVKIPLSDGRSQYVAPERPSPADVLRRLQHAVTEYVLSVDAGEDLVVVHTLTGRANAVAAAIDEMQWPDVVGTVAGDDTIVIVPRRRAARPRLLGMLRRVMEGGAP